MNTFDADNFFATIDTEDYADRCARQAREKFAKIKAKATTTLQLARVKAYEAHVEMVRQCNEKDGTNYNPHPYDNFKWMTCVLCNKEIHDDPYGHNPYPLKEEGNCCTKCNKLVTYTRFSQLRGVQG